MKMLRTPIVVASLGLALTALPPVVSADLTYNLQNYPADQNGWTLSGTITTDGNFGTLTPLDITSWTFTITNGTSTHSATSTIASVSGLIANQTSLQLPFNTQQDFLFLDSGFELNYEHDFMTNAYSAGELNQFGQFVPFWDTTNPAMGGTDPWVIAVAATTAVPEPSSLIMVLGLGAIGMFGYAWRRRGRKD